MSKRKLLIVAICLVAVGVVVSGVCFAASGFSFSSLMPDSEKHQVSESYDASGVEIITVDASCTDITVTRSPDTQIHIDSVYSGQGNFSIEQRGDTIEIVCNDNYKDILFSLKNGVFSSWSNIDSSIAIALPEGVCSELRLETSNADVYINDYVVNGGYVRCETSNSGINISNCSADGGYIGCETSNGRVVLESVFCGDTGEVELDSSNGRITANNVCSGNFSAETSNARITFEKLEARDISLDSSNGDISGTVVGSSENYKITADTSNGDLRIPAGGGNGSECSLKADTSNSDITINFVS